MRAYHPQSSLGECLASWIKDRGHLLIALESYFDGSNVGGWEAGSLVTLAGFAAEDSIWADFDEHWNEILQDDTRRPAAKYLHMKEAAHLEKEFHHKNGWNFQKVGFLVTDLLMYLQTVDKQRFRQFACTVDLTAHRKLASEGYKLADPLRLCIEHCPFTVLAWYVVHYPGVIHSAHYFFDQGEHLKAPFEERWISEKEKLVSPGGLDMYWSLIKSVVTADMRQKSGLQAADLLAWATNRTISGHTHATFKHLEPIMKTIIPSAWIYWDEKKFREDYADRQREI